MASKPNISLLFQTAALHSEKLRINGLIAVFLFMNVFTTLRAILNESLRGLFWKTLPLLIGAMLFEGILWYFIRQADRRKRLVPIWLSALTVILETSIPTIALFIMTTEPRLDPYEVLSAPAVSIYFLFLILSALRLNPLLCVLAGITASGGYFAVMAFVYSRWPAPPQTEFLSGTSSHVTYGILLFLGGILASVVAKKIRTEVTQGILQLETRQRMEADLEVARSIQTGLLPRCRPQTAGFDIAGHTWPADQTGGDYYDWFQLPDGRWIFSIADVTGHGIGPALLTANCRAYVHALFGTEGNLQAWIGRVNQFLAADLEMGRFVTFLAVLLNPADGSLSLLSAGHGPTLVYRSASGDVEDLPSQGPPLGFLPDCEFESPVSIVLNPGDFLVLLTDGFTEWANPQTEQFGVDRAKLSLRQHNAGPSSQIIHRLRDDVLAFSQGTAQKDDLTAVVIQRTAR